MRVLAKDSTVRDIGMGCPLVAQAATDLRRAHRCRDGRRLSGGGAGPVRQSHDPGRHDARQLHSRLTTAGDNGFVVWGKPAPADQAAEIRTIGVGSNTLIVQVFDPVPAAAPSAGSWIHQPHLEIWVGRNDEDVNTMLPLGQMTQTGVTLDGAVHRGVGKASPPPKVERWTARDERGRPVTVLRLVWPDEYALLNGVTVVYSQAEAGKQARLVATAGFANNRPIYVPDIQPLAGRPSTSGSGLCRIEAGRLVAIE